MSTFLLYLATTSGMKISGYSRIEAKTFTDARAKYRAELNAKGVDAHNTEILCEACCAGIGWQR